MFRAFPGPFFVGLVLLSLGAALPAEERWETLPDCRLLPNPANDGDSFHVRVAGKERIFRLYFVDAPETDVSLPERVAEQAKYFGLTVAQTLQVGIEAERFTRQKLGRPFSVRTCGQDARGRSELPRTFAVVEINGVNLAEELVAHGLARVYGAAADAPGLSGSQSEWQKLQDLEQKAKAQKLGGWRLASSRTIGRPPTTTIPRSGTDSFDAFFHPNASSPPKSSNGSVAEVKLDVNRASAAALEELPGVGPVLSARIIAARPFRSADELQHVPGIGVVKYKRLRPYFQ